MKNKLINRLVSTLVVLVLAGGGYALVQHKQGQHSEIHGELYYCPMHPQIQSDKPGTCPICYMNLVKQEKAQEEPAAMSLAKEGAEPVGYAAVSLSGEKQQLIGIKTVVVEKKTLTKTIRTFGYVAHDLALYEAQLEYIEAWRIYYAYTVRRPAKVGFTKDWRNYFLTSSTVGAWRSEDEAKAEQRLLRAEYELRHLGINEQQLLELRDIKYGQPWIRPDLLFFDKDEPAWVYAQIFESDLGFITVGQKAVVTIPSYGETTEGVVKVVTQMIDPATRSAQARIELPKYRGELMVNMFANVEIHVELNDYIVIPREALLDMGQTKIVFVQAAEGTFVPRHIKTSYEGDGMIAVTSGLKAGERIVVSGNFLLDSESRLKAAIEGASESTTSTTNTHVGH